MLTGLLTPRSAQHARLFAELEAVLTAKAEFDRANNRPIFSELNLSKSGDDTLVFEAMLRSPRYGFPLLVKQKESGALDRCGSILSGPFFCSEQYPWPDESLGTVEPIVQLNLDFAAAVAREEVGSGLVQVWARHGECWCTHLPRQAVRPELLTPPPNEERLTFGRQRGNLHSWSALDTQTAVWLTRGYQITGTKEPQLSISELITDTLDQELLCREEEYPDELGERARALRTALPSLRDGSFLFGNFYSMQYGPLLDSLLINLDTEFFRWGDDGSGQLFFSPTDPERFWFDWSSS